jgi:integrase
MAKKKKYSDGTKRHATQFPGVYQREAERVIGKPDIVFDISYKKDGKKVWEKVGWKSQGYSAELARQIRNERIIAMQHGEELPQDKKKAITYKTLATKYLKWSSENKNRKGIEDQSRYDNHLKDRFDDKRLDEISPFDLERMKSEMTKAEVAPKTIAHCLGLLRAMYNRAADWNLYQGPNPVKKVKMPVIQNARDRFLSFDEAEILLEELKRNIRFKKEHKELEDPKLHDMALLSLHTGARASEIFNLKGQDIDFRNGLITLRDTKNTETRYAPMTEKIREMLKGRIPADLNKYIFTDEDGKKIMEVSNAFERVIERLKLNEGVTDSRQRVVFHSLRHTFASWLAIQGTPLYTIAKLMGHKSISMSERYAHLSPDHKKDAVNGLEAALNGKNKVTEIKAEG